MREEQLQEEKVKEEKPKGKAIREKDATREKEVAREQVKESKELREVSAEHQERKEQRDDRDDGLIKSLKMLAPGTQLREGLENILRAKTGGLIVVGESPEVMALVEGGFHIDTDFSPPALYELAKMDGAIILSQDARRILYANTQLLPDPCIPSIETGIRHRTAERVARQTGVLVIAISQRRGVISMYRGATRYSLQDINVIISKANQAIQTLEKYKGVLDKALVNLTALEFEDLVTVYDVAKVVQRGEMVLRIVRELENYISELGTEGRLVTMQAEELVANVDEELLHVVQDYQVGDNKNAEEIKQVFSNWSSDELLDLSNISRALGYGANATVLDLPVYPRGYRLLQKIPRLPILIIENLVGTFKNLQNVLKASIEELDEVDGIGEARARAIRNGMRRMQEQVMLDRYM
jgi:diadenylate cyclase